MPERPKSPEHIKDVLKRYLRQTGLSRKLGKKEIFVLWPEVVGPDIAAHTRIAAFRKGILSVAVDSSAHFYELNAFLKEEIREKLNQYVSKQFVSKINFHLDLV